MIGYEYGGREPMRKEGCYWYRLDIDQESSRSK